MFDSKINRHALGKIGLFGWPWHGLVTQKEEGSTQMSVTLPNDETIDLKAYFRSQFMGGENAFAQPGTVLRFRDPRAQDAERSVEQLEKDQVAGIEWRPDVLYSPGERLLYGMTDRARYGQGWIWHDGLNNWIVIFTNVANQLYLRCLSDRRQPSRHVNITGQLLNTSRTNIIDALPDGAGIIVGAGWIPEEYNRDERTDGHGYQSGAHVAEYSSIYEIKINKSGEVVSATSGLIASRSQIAGKGQESREIAHYTQAPKYVISDGLTEIDGQLHLSGTIGLAEGGRVNSRDYIKSFSVNHSLTGCVISAFYKPDGDVGIVSVDFTAASRVDYSFPVNREDPEPFEMTGSSAAEVFTIPPYGQEALANSLAEAELIIDGTVTSRIQVSAASNYDWIATGDQVRIELFVSPITGPAYQTQVMASGVFKSTDTVEIKVTIDDALSSEEFFTLERTRDASDARGIGTRPVEGYAPPAFGPGWQEGTHLAVRFREYFKDVSNISIMRYAGNAFAFAYERRRESDMNWYSLIGPVVVPGHGVVDGAIKDRGWKESHDPLYGSFNPITGEMARDSKSAVFWV